MIYKIRFQHLRRIVCLLATGVIMAVAASSCTNDGDIGDLYGRWQLTHMQVADSLATPDDLYFSFQSSVVFVSTNDYALHQNTDYTGRYTRTADSLLITMVPRDSTATALPAFMQQRLGMPDYRSIRLRVGRLDGQHLTLHDGTDYWQFRKF